jgi:hypothetical protein
VHEHLRAADQRYGFDNTLSGMIVRAPHSLGRQYVAVALWHFAHRKGEDVVIQVAKIWIEQLFLPTEFLD